MASHGILTQLTVDRVFQARSFLGRPRYHGNHWLQWEVPQTRREFDPRSFNKACKHV